jgi:anti-anti-sigma factor
MSIFNLLTGADLSDVASPGDSLASREDRMQSFRLTEIDLDSGCREIQVEGELDLAVADRLQACLDRIDSEDGAVLIDLEQCQFIDSTGIAVILHAYNRLAERGQQVMVCAPSDQVLRILSVTGLTGNGLVFESAAAALARLQTA